MLWWINHPRAAEHLRIFERKASGETLILFAMETIPRRSAASDIARGTTRLLGDRGAGVIAEVALAIGRRVDLLAVDRRGEILIVEIKSSLADFRADRKWTEYLPYCDRFAFAVTPEFPVAMLPAATGLIVADAYGAEIIRDGPLTPLPAARRKAVLLRFALVAAARLNRLEDPPI